MYTFYKREKIVNQSVVNSFQRKVQFFYQTTLDVLDASLHILCCLCVRLSLKIYPKCFQEISPIMLFSVPIMLLGEQHFLLLS